MDGQTDGQNCYIISLVSMLTRDKNSVMSSWSSMLVVINKDSLMRGGVCGKLHGGWSQLFALHQ